MAWPLEAAAYKITSLRLLRNHQATRLVIQADSPLDFQVELAGPQTVVLHLPGSESGFSLPSIGKDPLVSSIETRPDPDGMALVVHTRAPGVTVLPFYEAATRQLTLELGGAPSVEVAVSPKPQAPASREKATAPEPTPQKAEQPPPAVLAVRLGSHDEYTRLVLDGDGPLKASLQTEGQRVFLNLDKGILLPGARLAKGDGRIKSIEVVRRRPLRLELRLDRPLAKHRLFNLLGGRKVVLDVETGAAAASEPKKPSTARAQAARPAALPAREIKVSPELPILEPDQVPQALPVPPGSRALPPQTARTGASPRTASEPEIPLASPAEAVSPQGSMVWGHMPPVPPPPALARPRGPLATAAISEGIKTPPQEGEAGTQAVIARLREARKKQRAKVSLPMPKPGGQAEQPAYRGLGQAAQETEKAPAEPATLAGRRYPQAAKLGAMGRLEARVQAMFDRAKKSLDDRNYAAAYKEFQDFLVKYPTHSLAPEATYRLADAYLYLHERNIFPFYQDAMLNYQRAIDLYPKSDQLPWALLMMGRTAMLAGEPYLAVGYFDLVAQDYPKSEYVPLAVVNRGKAYLAMGKYTRALDEFRLAAEKYPKSRYRKDADWGQAQALFGMARYQRASLLLKDMDRRWPRLRVEEPELLYYIGEAEFQMKNYADARRYFLWALNIKPDIRDNDIILTRIGDTYQFEVAYKAARDIYRQVINLYPNTDGALVARIRLAESPQRDPQHPWDIFQIQATTNAYLTYKELAKNYPGRPVSELARLKLGVYHYKKKEYDKSLEALQKLLLKDPHTPYKKEVEYTQNLAVMGLLEGFRAKGKALELMDAYLRHRALLTRPNGNKVLELLAWAYEQSGLYARAARAYQILIQRGVKEPSLKLALAENLIKLRDYEKVAQALADGVPEKLKGAKEIRARSILGRALNELGQYEPAVKQLKLALAKTPDDPKAAENYYALGMALSHLKRWEEALAALDKAQELLKDRKDEQARLMAYLITMEAGFRARDANLWDKSLAYFERAEAEAVNDRDKAQAAYELAQSQRKAGAPAQVAATYQRLAKMNVTPWSQMAARHLADMDLSRSLNKVGK